MTLPALVQVREDRVDEPPHGVNTLSRPPYVTRSVAREGVQDVEHHEHRAAAHDRISGPGTIWSSSILDSRLHSGTILPLQAP